MRCPDPTLHDPQAQPVAQLLFATLSARQTLDKINAEIDRVVPILKEQYARSQAWKQLDGDAEPEEPILDPLFSTPLGQKLLDLQHNTRGQLGHLARQYISLGIEERQIKVFEEWSNLLLPLLSSLLDDPDLALTRDQRRKAPDIIERHLAVLEPPSASSLEDALA